MIKTGFVRKVDEAGRLLIPKELRSRLLIHEGDAYELLLDNDHNTLIFVPYQTGTMALDATLSRLKYQVMKDEFQHKAEILHKLEELDSFIHKEAAK
ncbi:MAG: AbrB/MazE/SpoVT family DNA-binding domain-containing protein [bacterium]|nr:AbrB/MazE/SpoVT family DNA-binding domain-containing protein [bacterium]